MRHFLFMLFVWTSLYFCISSTAIAQEDRPNPDRPRIEQQLERIRMARNELNEQRHQLEMERQELEYQRDRMQQQRPWPTLRPGRMIGWPKPFCILLMVMCVVVHILVAVWVFQDIRIRGVGSGIWIVIALIAGLLGALVYAVVRLGDVKQSE